MPPVQRLWSVALPVLAVIVCAFLLLIRASQCLTKNIKLASGHGSCTAVTTYRSSRLEEEWRNNAARWGNASFCSKVPKFNEDVVKWLESISSCSNSTSSPNTLDKNIFSSFTTTYECGAARHSYTTWIEPLAHGLRHPNALCGRGADLVDRSYLLMAFLSDWAQHKKYSECRGRPCQAIYIDLGASTWSTGAGGPSQSWFVDTYKKHGIDFDQLFLWEAQVMSPATIFSTVPPNVIHKYHYYNVPASIDVDSHLSPVNVLLQVAQPGDFVLFKLDIDNFKVEYEIMDSILNNTMVLSLIDEFVFEYHVNFAPMMSNWGHTADKTKTLDDAYQLFYNLRQKGIRAHSWV